MKDSVKKGIIESYISKDWNLEKVSDSYLLVGPTGGRYNVFDFKDEVDVYTEFQHYQVDVEHREASALAGMIRGLSDDGMRDLEKKCGIRSSGSKKKGFFCDLAKRFSFGISKYLSCRD